MRLILKFVSLLLLVGVTVSPLLATVHCLDPLDVGAGGSVASMTGGSLHEDDCSFHENASKADVSRDNTLTIISATGQAASAFLTVTPLAPKIQVYALASAPSPGALPRASILRI